MQEVDFLCGVSRMDGWINIPSTEKGRPCQFVERLSAELVDLSGMKREW